MLPLDLINAMLRLNVNYNSKARILENYAIIKKNVKKSGEELKC